MLEKIIHTVEKKYKLRETKGVFVSGFAADGKQLFSEGMVQTDMPLEKTLPQLHTDIVVQHPDTKVLTIDIVTTFFEETNIDKIPTTSPKLYGFAVVDEHGKTGVILPATAGVADAKHALYLIKQQYLLQGKVKIYIFTTDRLLIL